MSLKNLLPLFIFLTFSKVLAAPGVVVLSGGGGEGDIGVTTDWSYPLYKKLIENGDTTGDKKIKVVVLSLEKPDSNFMVDYLKSMGADSSQNLVVSSKKEANDPKVDEALKDADVVFIRGGNQGKAYQLWKGTKVHEQIKALGDRGGAIGGTSSGAMGLSGYSITGGQDFDSKEVLSDSHSPLLNDKTSPHTSGIHNDFLNAVPGVLADTHCGERGRVGRLLSVMAKATEDFRDNKMISVCLEEQTGIAVKNGKAEVFGTGLVHFLTETSETKKERIRGKPLSYTDVRDDALTEGWVYDLQKRAPDLKNLPKDAKLIIPVIDCATVSDKLTLKSSNATRVTFTDPTYSSGLSIAEDAYSDERLITRNTKKGVMQSFSFDKMAKNPHGSVVMVNAGSELRGLKDNTLQFSGETPALVLDCKHCSYTSSSSFLSPQDQGSETLRSSALVNMRLHVLGTGDTYNVQTHKLGLKREMASLEASPCKYFNAANEKIEKFIANELKIVQKLNCSK